MDDTGAGTMDDIGAGTQDAFAATWGPRIGPAATALLRRDQHRRGLKVLAMLGGAGGAPYLLFGLGGVLGVVLGVVAEAVAVALFLQSRRLKSGVAREMSAFYGTHIRLGELPVMNAAAFDRWASRRGLTG